MFELIKSPWPWYIAGPLITLTMMSIGYLGKSFGISSTLKTVCSAAGAGKSVKFFDINWRNQVWNLVFVLGAICGGFIASTWMSSGESMSISSQTIEILSSYNIKVTHDLIPTAIFNWEALFTSRGLIMMVLGGFMIGFGTRYAGGCTSGHAITGLSNLQTPSLIAVIGFFIGRLIMTHLLFPIILTL